MAVKKETKKKLGDRGKAKPIVNVKKISLKEKEKIVKDLENKLPEEDKKKENTGGRPTVMTPRVIDKLKLCFSVGMTDEQACYFCEISTDALYKYQREEPEFIKQKEILKESITMQSRVNIGRSIKAGNVGDSWKWLEKKDPSFIPKLSLHRGHDIPMSEEEEEMYKRIKNNNLL